MAFSLRARPFIQRLSAACLDLVGCIFEQFDIVEVLLRSLSRHKAAGMTTEYLRGK